MKAAFAIFGFVLLCGCAAQPDARQATATAVAAGAQDCIQLAQISARRAVPPNSVLFEMVGPVNYRNDLAGECPGLARLGSSASVELVNPFGGRLCRNDQVRLFDPVLDKATGINSAPLCRLGRFVPVPRG